MAGRFDVDARYFPDVVDAIVDRLDAGPAGRVVVVSGTPDSGRSTVLGQAAADLRQAGFRVVRREVRGGVLQTVDTGGVGEHVVQGAKVLAAVLQVVNVGVGGLIALAAEIATTYQMVDGLDPRDVPGNPYVHVRRVADAVEQRAAQEPLALVIDDADKLDDPAVWWDGLFGTAVPRLAARLPVLVVLGVERTSTARSHALDTIDKRLLPADLADEITLPRLDPERIVAALGPVEDALLGPLRSLVQGHPSWLQDVWRTWREQGIVVHRDGRWTVAPDARDRVRSSLHGWVESALHAAVAPDSDAFWRAKEILETAALEGPRFTVEALAAVLGKDDVDDLIDWIDDHLASPDGPSLLVEDGFVEPMPGVDAPELRCYRFRSAMVAGVLRQETLAGTSGKVLAGKYAHALARVYRSYPLSNVAWTISRLATTAGDAELTETIWRRANRLEGVEEAARLARFLVDHLDIETASAEELAATVERLNDLCYRLIGRWNDAVTFELCRTTERAARAVEPFADDPKRHVVILLDTLQNAGHAAIQLRDTETAVSLCREAAALSTSTADDLRIAESYVLLANVEFISHGVRSDRFAEALAHIETALEYARRGESRKALLARVVCLEVFAQVMSVTSEAPKVVQAVREVAVILLDSAFRGTLANCASQVFTCQMRAAQIATSERQWSDAERFLVTACRCYTEVGQHAVTLSNLSFVRVRLGDSSGAVLAACQALRLSQGLNTGQEGVTLLRLAEGAALSGEPAVGSLVALADARLSENAWNVELAVLNDFRDVLAQVDDATRQEIEQDYRADRGTRLLREVFGIDVEEIDRLNERLGDATEGEMRGFLLDVQQYCTR